MSLWDDVLFVVNRVNNEARRQSAETDANDLDAQLSTVPPNGTGEPAPGSPLTPAERTQIAEVMADALLSFLPAVASEEIEETAHSAILDYLESISTPLVDSFLESTFEDLL